MTVYTYILPILVAIAPVGASALTLTTGTGDGSVTIGVDGFGSFGSSIDGDGTGDAFFDPLGVIGQAGTVYQSAVAVSFGSTRPFLTTGGVEEGISGGIDLEIQSSSETEIRSTFSIGSLDFSLVQSVDQTLQEGVQIGSILNQVYRITNTADVTNSFEVVRYIDGDLDFDQSIADGGGRLIQNGNEILFETDAASETDASTTFLGITGIGGTQPTSNRFEISSYSGLADTVGSGGLLGDVIENDFDGDGFIDEAFDVTMALRNTFSLAAGETATYTTQTLFGNSIPPAPGSLEALPLLPETIDLSGAFLFTLDTADIVEGETIFFDPFVSTGYTYTVTGGEFDSVTAPTFAAVADPDGYFLNVGGSSIALAAGQNINFETDLGLLGITEFSITGISEALMLDPADGAAFVTGASFENITGTSLVLSQQPIETFVPAAAIPLPASAFLLGFGMAGLGAMRRRQSRAA